MNNSRFADPGKLLEKAREGWDYFISDQIMYAAEIRDGEDVRKQEGYIKDYIEGRLWFEVVAHRISDEKEKLVWLVESCPCELISSGKPDAHIPTDGSDNAMFVFISQLTEDAEKFQLTPLRSVVWLKRLHSATSIRQKKSKVTSGQSTKGRGINFRYIYAEGEVDTSLFPLSQPHPLVSSVFQRKRPSDVVKCGSEVTQNIADNQTPIQSDSRIDSHLIGASALKNDIRNTIRKIQLALSADSDFWIARGATDSDIEATDMYVRPLNLEIGAIKWMHDLSL